MPLSQTAILIEENFVDSNHEQQQMQPCLYLKRNKTFLFYFG